MNTVPDQTSPQKGPILVIDDDQAVGDALKLVLESHDYEVVLVGNGREGILQAGDRQFCIGIIDLFLPDISGLRAIEVIRAQQPEAKLILITGAGTPEAFSEARRLGVFGILPKPFRTEDILQLVTRAISS